MKSSLIISVIFSIVQTLQSKSLTLYGGALNFSPGDYVTGGMPESILMWTEARDVSAMQESPFGILGAYERNLSKHPIKNAAASDEIGKVPAIAAVIEQSQYGNLQRVGNSYWTACTKFADIIAARNPDNVPLQDLMDTLTNGIAASAVQ